ncbi:NAD-dependent epimerase/dehydratase family protein [Candidatus Hydrogenedentota bacterium]
MSNISNPEKILVTGGAGFIGSFLVDALVEKGHEVTIFDNLEPQIHPDGNPPDYLNSDARFVQGDVRDYDAFKEEILKADVIFHEAAAVGVGQSQYQIKHYMDVNTGGTANLLDVLANNKHNVRKVLVAASMTGYGEGAYWCEKCGKVRPRLRTVDDITPDWSMKCPKCGVTVEQTPISEDDVRYCNSVYGYSKRDQEDLVLSIGQIYELPVVAFRYFNVYGPRQSLSNPYTGVGAIFLSRLMNDNTPVIYEDGRQTRDFINVRDIVRANIMCMESAAADYQVFNLGSGVGTEIGELARILARLVGKDIEPDITNHFRKGDIRHCTADITKIKGAVGFEPEIAFEQGIAELYEWSRGQEPEDKFEQATRELKDRGLV